MAALALQSSAVDKVCGALLVGSMPLSDSSAVFRFSSEQLGQHLRRMPDGETGDRINWTQWQIDVLKRVDALESEIVDSGYVRRSKFRLKPGRQPSDLAFPQLDYAKAAKESYAAFRSLKAAGVIRPDIRMQVCLPTPLAPIVIYVFPEHQRVVEPSYEQAMLAELAEIVASIPKNELAIQWDTAVEFAILEQVMPHALDNPLADILARLVRLGNAVPDGVELGFHLCYGDSGGRHFKEPGDASKLVTVANGIAGSLKRRLHWLHMPVPKERSDPQYFTPLDNLRLGPATELYLGLVHASDGVDGTLQRIGAASLYASSFGVATECGCGRRAPEVLQELMTIHRAVSAPVREGS